MRRVAVFSLVLIWTTAVVAENKKLVFVADRNAPPFSYTEAGKAKGLWVDLATAVADKMGTSYSVELGDWATAQQEVVDGKADVLYSLSFTPERARVYDLSFPVIKDLFTFFSLGKIGAIHLNDLNGVRVGVTRGGSPHQIISNMKDVTLVIFPTYEEAFTSLSEGRIDIFAADRWVGTYVLSQGEWPGVTPALGNFASFSSGFAVKKGNIKLRDRLNEAIVTLKKEGAFDSITKRWQAKTVVFITHEQVLLAITGVLTASLVVLALWVFFHTRLVRQKNRSQAILASIIENTDAIIDARDLDGLFLFCSEQGALNYGCLIAKDLVGRFSSEVVKGETLKELQRTDAAVIKSGERIQYEQHFTRGNQEVIFLATKAPLKDSVGRTIGVVGHSYDISSLKKSNDLKDKLFMILAHDLRGPIGSMATLLGYVVEQSLESIELADLKEILDTSHQSASQTYALVENVLGWVRGQLDAVKGHEERIPLLPILSEVLRWFATQAATKELTLEVQCPKSLSLVVDRGSLQTILRNLLSNAIKYSPRGALILLRAQYSEPEVLIEVIDQGCGISPEKMATLFGSAKVETTLGTNGESGNGLGMMFCADLARSHGGRLEVESEGGKGSTFRLVLPDPIDGELRPLED